MLVPNGVRYRGVPLYYPLRELYTKGLASVMNSTEVQNPRRKLDVFGSVLACAKSAHCFRSSLTRFADFVSLSSLITLPQTVRLFYVSLRSQAPKQQYTVLSFSLAMRRHGHSHKLTSSRALRYYTVDIPF